jgi:LuxR family maltose regulon positive regulatory protein
MAIPILQTKLTVPPMPAAYLPRPRLDQRWREWAAHRLVLVTAGAGCGKTLFLAANARSGERPCIWYSLDEQDLDPVTFGTHLLHACQTVLLGPSPQPAAESAGWGAATAQESWARVLRALQDLPAGTVLVLDDAHLISASPEVIHLLEQIVRFLPPGLTMIVASREPVPLPTIKLRSSGAAVALSTADLRFTGDEVAAVFARRFSGASLPPHLAGRIAARTEGWAAGIEMFFQILRGTTPDAVEEALERMRSSGGNWFDYFAEEVVARLDGSTQTFLRRSSVLPRLETELCNRVLRIRDSQRVLESLVRRQLFTFPVGEDGRSFRYHHLFRGFLRAQLHAAAPAGEVRQLQRRAAAVLARTGALAEATAVLADAGDHAGALDLIEKGGEKLLEAGQHTLLQRVFEAIPESSVQRRPAALVVLARLRVLAGRWEEAETIYRRVLRRMPRSERRAEPLLRLASLMIRRGDYAAGMALCRRALQRQRELPPVRRAEVLTLMACAIAEQGLLDEGERYFEKAAAILRRCNEPVRLAAMEYWLAANVYSPRGEFARAKAAVRRALLYFRRQRDLLEIAHAVMALAFVTAAAAEAREARELATEGLRLAEALEYAQFEGLGHYVLGQCALLDGDHATARKQFRAAQEIGDRVRESDIVLYPRLGQIELALAEGNRPRALRLAEETLILARRQTDLLQEGQCRILLGIAVRDDHPRKATAHWRRAEAIFRQIGASFELHRLLLVRLDAGDVPSARRAALLTELLRGTARQEHDFLFLTLMPERAVRVLTDALRSGVEGDRAHALLVRLGEPAVSPVTSLLQDPDPAVRRRAVGLLAQLGGEQSRAALTRLADRTTVLGRAASRAVRELGRPPVHPLRIQALGPLTVAVAGPVARAVAWRSQRARRLFEFLLTQHFRWVARDVVLEALWPDVDPDRAHNSFRQTIHLLRRALEPDLRRTADSRHVTCRGEGCQLQPGEGHIYDVAQLEALLDEATSLRRGSAASKAEPLLAQAIELYRGDFLADSLYEEFAAPERERLRDRFVRAIHALLALRSEARRWEEVIPLCRRGLAADPYDEICYEHLLRAHLQLRNRHEALAVFHQYENLMRREIGSPPSPRLRALANQATALGAGDETGDGA